MRLLFALVSLPLLLAACERGPIGNANVPEPAKPVELSKYLGTWYEIGRYENRFEKGCSAAQAEYSMRDDGTLRVLNSCVREGTRDVAEGQAYVVNDSANAKLRVSFFWPFYGDYWVLDHADDYSWSIVGEPSGRYLWILMREAQPTPANKQQLWKKAGAMGYNLELLRDVSR